MISSNFLICYNCPKIIISSETAKLLAKEPDPDVKLLILFFANIFHNIQLIRFYRYNFAIETIYRYAYFQKLFIISFSCGLCSDESVKIPSGYQLCRKLKPLIIDLLQVKYKIELSLLKQNSRNNLNV